MIIFFCDDQRGELRSRCSRLLAGVKFKKSLLTLADSSVLDDGAGDRLENAGLTAARAHDKRMRRKRKAAGPGYTGLDDDEFAGGAGPDGSVKRQKTILAKYDDGNDANDVRENDQRS